MKKEFELVQSILYGWENKGIRLFENGTKLICPVPHIAPRAWLHKIYGGLNNEKINELESSLSVKFPVDYIEFLKCSNGINIFSDSISVWGLRTSFERTGDKAIQPYDLLSSNEELRGAVPSSWMFFGSYSWDGSVMFYDLTKTDSKVYRCENGSDKIIGEWNNIWEWLLLEAKRLSNLFDSCGVEYDENTPTVPDNK